MKSTSRLLTTFAAIFLLSACNGGSDSSGSSATVVTTTAEGFWTGTASTGVKVSVAILENGETWGVYYTANNLIVGALRGTTTSSGTSISGSGSDYDIQHRTVTPGTYTGTFSSKNNINVTMSNGSSFSGTYDASYDQAASLTAVSGSFTGSGVTGSTSWQSSAVGISSLGDISAVSPLCSATGKASPRASGKNVFDVTITFTGTNCALGNGAVTSGVAYYDTAKRQVLVTALKADKSDGFIYIGSKP